MYADETGPYSRNSALLLWLAWIFGFGGIHRIYLGKPASGVLYLLTWGLFGFGQVFDLLTMGRMVDEANARQLAGSPHRYQLPSVGMAPTDSVEQVRIKLLNAAKQHGNALSVGQGVMATGKTFKEVEDMLDDMARSGYVGIDNDPTTGAVVYTFGDLG